VRVYIAGPMTGLPEFNFPAFHKAAAAWRAAGWTVLNPAESFDGATDLPYKDYAAHDVGLIRTCDAIAMLPGWDGPNARGSVWEREIALLLGLTVYDATNPVPPPPKESVLQEAQRLVHGDRGASYGHPYYDYRCTGKLWSALIEHWLHGIGFLDDAQEFPTIPPRIATEMMIAMKLSREMNKGKRDNRTDTAGYAECAQMIADFEDSR